MLLFVCSMFSLVSSSSRIFARRICVSAPLGAEEFDPDDRELQLTVVAEVARDSVTCGSPQGDQMTQVLSFTC